MLNIKSKCCKARVAWQWIDHVLYETCTRCRSKIEPHGELIFFDDDKRKSRHRRDQRHTRGQGGRYTWIEFKRPGNKQQENQIVFEQRIKQAGGVYIVIESLDELLDYLGDTEQGELEFRV